MKTGICVSRDHRPLCEELVAFAFAFIASLVPSLVPSLGVWGLWLDGCGLNWAGLQTDELAD